MPWQLGTEPIYIAADDTQRVELTNSAGDTLYYGSSAEVNEGENEGSLTANQKVTLKKGTYVISGGQSLIVTRELFEIVRRPELEAHSEDETDIHGIADTSLIGSTATKLDNLAIFNVKDYGAVGDGETDDTAAIQAAIDAAQEKETTNGASVPVVVVPAGDYIVSSTITLKSAHLRCGGMQTCRVRWNGEAGGTMFTKDVKYEGGTSYWELRDIKLENGTTEPATFLDFSQGKIDVGFLLDAVFFRGCSGDAIKLAGFFNCHWEHLRWDRIGGWAINCVLDEKANLGSFVIDSFTYDAVRDTGEGAPGFMLLDNSVANKSNVGVMRLANARIEVNTAWTGNKAVVECKSANPPLGPRWVGLQFSNIAYQDVNGMVGDCLVYSSGYESWSDESGGPATLALDNVRLELCDKILGGDWGGSWSGVLPVSAAGAGIRWGQTDFATIAGASGLEVITLGGNTAFRSRRYTDDEPRHVVTGDGKHEWGKGGESSPDANLYRSAAETLKTDGKLVVGAETEIDGNLNHDGSKAGFFGVAPVSRPAALTASDATAVDATYGEDEQKVIENLRSRVDELEEKLQALGLVS